MCHDLWAWTSLPGSQQPIAASVIILSVWPEGTYHSTAAELRDRVEVSECKAIHNSSTKQHINTQGLLHPCETSSSKSLLSSSSKNRTGLCFVSSNRWKGGGVKAPTELSLLISVSGTPLPAHSAGQTLPSPAGTDKQCLQASMALHTPQHCSVGAVVIFYAEKTSPKLNLEWWMNSQLDVKILP